MSKKIAGNQFSGRVIRQEHAQYHPYRIRQDGEGNVIGGFQESARYTFGKGGGMIASEGRLVGPHYCGPLYSELSPWVYRRQ